VTRIAAGQLALKRKRQRSPATELAAWPVPGRGRAARAFLTQRIHVVTLNAHIFNHPLAGFLRGRLA
jgi:hypothetical protein